MNREELVAEELLKIKAIFLQPNKPFTWASGIKSPIYCDIRLVASYPKTRDIIESKMVELIKEKFPNADYVVGTSTAGIYHAALIANLMNLPMAYVRSNAKDHGRNKCIEGLIHENKKVVVVEDLLSTGKSTLEVVNILREEKIHVEGVVSIFTYGLQICKKNLKKANVVAYSLSNFNALSNLALKRNVISKQELDKLLKFQKDPNKSSWLDK